ncbi:MAG: exo-alpha-sialidase [Verrucomicrobiaceae bacterium]
MVRFLLALILCPLMAVFGGTPVLNDGTPTVVLSFRQPTVEEAVRFTSATLSLKGTTDFSEVAEIALIHHRGGGNREFGRVSEVGERVTFSGEMDFTPGNHLFLVEVKMKKGANLDHKIGVVVESMSDSDGKVYRPKGEALQRLAYPIHHQGQFDCHTFRIPGIARAKDGSLLAVYDLRYRSSRDLQGHMDIGLSRSRDGGRSWSDPRPIMDMGGYGGKPEDENGCSDPCILLDEETGEIFVFAVWTHGRPGTHQWHGTGSMPGLGLDVSSQFMMVKSEDHGVSWSQPVNLTGMVKDPAWYLFAPAPGNGITLKDGTLVIPSQGRDAKGLPFSNIMYSKDHGKSWTVSAPARTNTTECAVVELADGALMLNMRDNRNRKDQSGTNGRAVSVTRDLGATWEVHATDHGALPEPVCMASLIRHGELLLFSNPKHKSSRTNITVRVSADGGLSWGHELLLDSAGTGYGYSSLVMVDEKTVGILYESSQADLIFQRIPLTDLIK